MPSLRITIKSAINTFRKLSVALPLLHETTNSDFAITISRLEINRSYSTGLGGYLLIFISSEYLFLHDVSNFTSLW